MSSTYPRSPEKCDLLVVTPEWLLPVAEHFLASQKSKVAFVPVASSPTAKNESVCYRGNGECLANARNIFGRSLAEAIWNISDENIRLAESLLTQKKIHGRGSALRWFSNSERETKILEESIDEKMGLFRPGKPAKAGKGEVNLEEKALILEKTSTGESVDWKFFEKKNGEYVTRFSGRDGIVFECRSSALLAFCENMPLGFFPSLADKWVPVTLPLFDLEFKDEKEIGLFHLGADLFNLGAKGYGTSFRNLYEDKAFGHGQRMDTVAQENIFRFALTLDPSVKMSHAHLQWEAISCDGLPIVGGLAEYPGVYVAGCFSGRTENFAFAVCKGLAETILHGKKVSSLDPFSTKRFV